MFLAGAGGAAAQTNGDGVQPLAVQTFGPLSTAGGAQPNIGGIGGIAFDSSGNLYGTDEINQTVFEISPNGAFATLAGVSGQSGSTDGAAGQALFKNPEGIAVDGAGNVYICDTGNATIRVLTPGGMVSTLAGLAGSPGYADGTQSTARFEDPQAIAIGSDGNLYVSDNEKNYVIRKVTPEGVVTTFAGTAGTAGTADGALGVGQFADVSGLAFGSNGTLYAADSVLIREIDPNGAITTVAGVPNQPGILDGPPQVAHFSPWGIAVNSAGTIFVSSAGTIREITPTCAFTVAGESAIPLGPPADGIGIAARFGSPSALAFGPNGDLHIADGGKYSDGASAEIREAAPAAGTPGLIDGSPQWGAPGGSTVTFTVDAEGSGLTYQWQKNGTALSNTGNASGVTTPTLTLTNVQPSDVATYAVIVANTAGAIQYTTALLDVTGPVPQITVQPIGKTVTAGTGVTFSVAATSGLTPTYQWYQNGTAIFGATSSSYTIAAAEPGNIGAYTVKITNVTGSVTSAAATLVVNPASATTPEYAVVDLGTLGGANSEAYGINAAGQVVGGSQTATNASHGFLYAAGTMNDLGASTYTAYAINDLGQIVGDGPPESRVGLIGEEYPSAVMYDQGVVTVLAQAGYAYGINDSGQVVITQWGGGTAIMPSASLYSNGLLQPLSTATGYIGMVYAINASGTAVGDGYVWTSGNYQSINLDAYCINDSGTMAGGIYKSGTDDAAILSNGTIQDLGAVAPAYNTVALGINNSGELVGNGQSPTDERAFVWRPGAGMADLNTLVTLGNGSAPGLVELQSAQGVNDAGQIVGWGLYYTGSALVTHAVLLNPVVAPSLPASSGPIVITDGSLDSFGNPSQTVAAGTTAVLTAVVGGTGPLSYQWLFNGAPISGATSSTYTISGVQLSNTGLYSVTASNLAGSVTTPAVNLIVSYTHDALFSDQWQLVTALPNTITFDAAAYVPGAGAFAAFANDGSVWLSASGVANWTQCSPGVAQTWSRLNSAIAFGTNGALAVGDGGAVVDFTFTAPAEGGSISATAAALSTGASQLLTGIASSGARLVAVGYAGTAITAPIAAGAVGSWTADATGTSNNLNAVAYGNGEFVAVGLQGTVLTSADGVTWTAQPFPFSGNLYSVAYGSGNFVAVGDNRAIYTSPNGVTWIERQAPLGTQAWIRVAYGDGIFATVGQSSGFIETSADGGVTWAGQYGQWPSSSTSVPTVFTLNGVAFGSTTAIAIGTSGVVDYSNAISPARLMNLSASADVGTNANVLVTGFAIGGQGTKALLLRGAGPSLSSYGVPNVLEQPQLTLFNSSATSLAQNAGWDNSSALSQVFTQVGAFAFQPNSADAALEQSLATGVYTSEVSGLNGGTGNALNEIYDADPPGSPTRLVNISARAEVAGGGILTDGFVISGSTPETVIIRGVGPGLTALGLSGLPQPLLTVYDASGRVLASNTGWGGSPALAAAFASVGAFALQPGSADCAIEITVAPGEYTVQVSGRNAATGLALAEIYEVPQQ